MPAFVRDLSNAYGALRKFDDGRNFPIRAFWEEESQCFARPAAQTQLGPTRPVLFKGVATIAEKTLERLQRYFSRRIHSAARDELIKYAKDLSERETETLMPITGESSIRAYDRLTQLQGPLGGAFLKDSPMSHRLFWDVEWEMTSCFRFGIPLRALSNDPWLT